MLLARSSSRPPTSTAARHQHTQRQHQRPRRLVAAAAWNQRQEPPATATVNKNTFRLQLVCQCATLSFPPLLRTHGGSLTHCTSTQVVAYDGSDFAGFQFQPKVRTVQGELEKAAARVLLPAGRVVGGCQSAGARTAYDLFGQTHASRRLLQPAGPRPCLTQAPAARTLARTPQVQLHTSTWSAAPTASSLTA